MAAPETLIKLLSAAGPSGYEQAPAAVFREAAGAFAEVSFDTVGSSVARVPGTGRREVGRDRRPHRRDRADRPPHRRRRLPVVHRHRRLGPGDPGRPARRGRHARRRACPAWSARSRSTSCAIPRSARRRPSSRTCTSTSARRTATRRARCVRIGDFAVIAAEPRRAAQRPARLALDGQPARLLRRRSRPRAWWPRTAAPPATSTATAVAQEEITFAGARTTSYSLRPDVAIAVDVTFATDAPGTDEKELGRHASAPGRSINRGSTLDPAVFELLLRDRRGRGHPVHGQRLRALHGHRRGRDPHLPRGHPHGRRLDPAALHALAGRDGPARRRREHRPAARRVRQAAGPGHGLHAR